MITFFLLNKFIVFEYKLQYYINPRWHGFEAEDYEDDLTPSARYDRLGIGMPQINAKRKFFYSG